MRGLGIFLVIVPIVASLLGGTAARAQTDASDAGVSGASASTCIIKPHIQVQLGSAVDGLLSAVLVDRGDVVHKDQIVAQIESSVEQATLALDQVRAANDSAIKVEEIDRELSVREAARKRSLVEKGIENQNALDELETKVHEGDLRIQQARTDQQIAALTAIRSERALALRQIRSPIDGVIIERKLSAGEYVYEQTSIMTIAQLDPLNVEVVLPMRRYGEIAVGATAIVHPEAPIAGSYRAMVDVIDPVIDAASETFGIRLLLPNPHQLIPAGIRCSVDWPSTAQATR
ncbi:MAG TPA: efflux RND transporter periplasmic adaptor subunit [Acetobacteraceae bacterium]|nr:efflux RND transporter periplasmic adaptor subunit [Acetobacteraceae bacterium]